MEPGTAYLVKRSDRHNWGKDGGKRKGVGRGRKSNQRKGSRGTASSMQSGAAVQNSRREHSWSRQVFKRSSPGEKKGKHVEESGKKRRVGVERVISNPIQDYKGAIETEIHTGLLIFRISDEERRAGGHSTDLGKKEKKQERCRISSNGAGVSRKSKAINAKKKDTPKEREGDQR